jgi:hypothetical protein
MTNAEPTSILPGWLPDSKGLSRPCISALLPALLILSAIPGGCRDAFGDEAASSLAAQALANQAVVVKYQAARHKRDAYLATATIKSADQTIKNAPARIEKERKVLEKALEAKVVADANLAEKEAALKTAQDAAEGTDDETLKAVVVAEKRERDEAKRQADRKKYDVTRAEGRVKTEKDRIIKANADKAAAEKSIPELEAAEKEANQRYEELKAQAIEAEGERAVGQKPKSLSTIIDKEISARLTKAKIPASPLVEDGKFLRRVTLDIAGRIPTYAEVIEFLGSDNPDKRAAAVDRLLASDDYGRSFGTIFSDLTTHRPTTTATRSNGHFREWLIESLNRNRAWDDVVTDMIAGEGDTGSNLGSIFLVAYRLNNQPDPPATVAAVGEMFMGIQLACAQCHDHPFVEEWSMDDFWATTSLFSRARLKGTSIYRALEYVVTDDDVAEKELFRMGGMKYPPPLPGGQIAIPDPTDETKTLKNVSAIFLDETVPELSEKGFYRKEFAAWLTSTDNPYFARATVNRLWAHFFARGLVQPIADMSPDNEATHPEILTTLEDGFRQSGYDLKFLVRAIVASETYQSSSRPLDENDEDKELYSHMAVKTLEADALFDSLTVAIGRSPMLDNRRQTYKDLFDTRLPEVDPGKFTHSIPQVLRMMNAREYNDASGIVGTVTNGKDRPEAVAGLFLAALTRRPNEEEAERMLKYVEEADDLRTAYSDIYWVLINSAEFLVNH